MLGMKKKGCRQLRGGEPADSLVFHHRATLVLCGVTAGLAKRIVLAARSEELVAEVTEA